MFLNRTESRRSQNFHLPVLELVADSPILQNQILKRWHFCSSLQHFSQLLSLEQSHPYLGNPSWISYRTRYIHFGCYLHAHKANQIHHFQDLARSYKQIYHFELDYAWAKLNLHSLPHVLRAPNHCIVQVHLHYWGRYTPCHFVQCV